MWMTGTLQWSRWDHNSNVIKTDIVCRAQVGSVSPSCIAQSTDGKLGVHDSELTDASLRLSQCTMIFESELAAVGEQPDEICHRTCNLQLKSSLTIRELAVNTPQRF